MVAVHHVVLALEVGAVAHQNRILDQRAAPDLDLVAGIGHRMDATQGHMGAVGAIHVEQIDPV